MKDKKINTVFIGKDKTTKTERAIYDLIPMNGIPFSFKEIEERERCEITALAFFNTSKEAGRFCGKYFIQEKR